MQETTSLTEICAALDVSRGRVEQWIKVGWLRMDNDVARGVKRAITFRDAMNIATMKELADLKMPGSVLKQAYVRYTYRQGAFLVIAHEAIPLPTDDSGSKTGVWIDGDDASLIGRIVPDDKLAKYLADPRRKTCIVLNLDKIERRVKFLWDGDE